jgi:hypothetical protein
MAGEAERYLRRLAEAELRQPEPEPERGPGPIDRLRAAADALTWAGAVDQATADAVVAEFVTARDLRAGVASGRRPIRLAQQGWATQPLALTGPVRVMPVGATLPGRYQPLHLLALTLAPGQAAVVTVAGLIDPSHRPGRDDLPIGPYGPSGPDWGLTFTGADGTRYPFTAIGGGTSDGVWWRQDLVLPAVAADLGAGDWLEVTADDGSAVRVNGADGRRADDPEAAYPRWPDASWLLENIAAGQLWLSWWAPDPGRPAAGSATRLAVQADAVLEVGLVADESPARRRYAALAERLAGTGTGADDLPAAWADVLAAADRSAGHEAAYPGVAVLPPLDGIQFAVTGVVSAADSTTVQALAWRLDQGLGPAEANQLTTVLFSWWARDDTGHWHVGRALGGHPRQPVIHLDVVLVPPLPPAATALEVIVTGRGGRVQATVDL